MFYICFLAPHFPTFIGTDFFFFFLSWLGKKADFCSVFSESNELMFILLKYKEIKSDFTHLTVIFETLYT